MGILKPRGIRNNNPLNIRVSSTKWVGKCLGNTDGAFEQFQTLEYGLRAAIINIRTYIKRDHVDMIRTIISKWAPESDGNNVSAYVSVVCKKANLEPSTRVRLNDKNIICRLVWAMAYVECGEEISFGRVENAWALI